MKLLLDTNALLWWFDDYAKLSASAYEAIADGENDIVVSIVSLWEIAIKSSLGKLTTKSVIEDRVLIEGFDLLPVTLDHIRMLRSLPVLHRDPFDRMLIAQAKADEMVMVTRDRHFADYDLTLLPA